MILKVGMLGVPRIFISNQTRGYFEDQERNYRLLGFIISDPEQAIEKAVELLKNDHLKSVWQKKRRKLLNEKIDVTKFMTEFIENYPESFEKVKRNG
jgi:predicted glycosyltransferase